MILRSKHYKESSSKRQAVMQRSSRLMVTTISIERHEFIG
jgi:hypothetical protein